MATPTSLPVDFTVFHNIVNGQPRGSAKTYRSVDPATKEPLWDAPVATKEDLDDAVRAARTAFKSWSKTSIQDRSNLLKNFAAELMKHRVELGQLLTKELRRPNAFFETNVATQMLKHCAGLNLDEEVVDDVQTNRRFVTRRMPLGIVAAICPWNLPLGLAVQKIAPALMAGNCIIVKPSPYSPYSGLKLVEIAQSIFPPGVVQVLGGDEQLGPWMVKHPDIQKISFTGSCSTGKKVVKEAADTMKRVTLELGGNDACIVCPDVSIPEAAQEVARGALYNTGMACLAAKRVYVHDDIYDKFLEALIKAVKSLQIGDATSDSDVLGPIQNEMQYRKVLDYYKDSIQQGHKFAFGGEFKEGTGFFIEPAVIDSPPHESRIVQEEPFGPIFPVLHWKDEDDVIERANSVDVGLTGSVFSSDVVRAERIARQLETGLVWINEIAKVNHAMPFGGWKQSGLGFEGGREALHGYTNVQVLYIPKIA